jgi:hypothetical protein
MLNLLILHALHFTIPLVLSGFENYFNPFTAEVAFMRPEKEEQSGWFV